MSHIVDATYTTTVGPRAMGVCYMRLNLVHITMVNIVVQWGYGAQWHSM